MEDSVFVVQSVLMGFYFNIFWQFTFKIVKHDSHLYLWYALQLESKPRILYKHTHVQTHMRTLLLLSCLDSFQLP